MRKILVFGLLTCLCFLTTKGQENTTDYWVEKGLALLDKEAFPDALGCFDKAISLNQSCSEAWYGKGVCLQYYNPNPKVAINHAEALKCFQRAIEINSSYVEAYKDMGWSLAVMGSYDEAFRSVDKALELKPNYADAMVNKGAIYFEMHNYDSALEWYKKAIAADPNNADAWFNIGNTYAKMDPNDPRSTEAFNRAKELDKQKTET